MDEEINDYTWPEIEQNYTYNAQHHAIINSDCADICTYSEGIRTMKLIDYIKSNLS